MSIERDPVRWTDPNGDAPDVLRDLMGAGANELPSAAKIAALGAKVAATGGAGAAGALGATKLWVALAGLGVGAAMFGGALLYAAQPSTTDRAASQGVQTRIQAPTASPSQPVVTPLEEENAPSAERPAVPAARGLREVTAPTQPAPFVEATAAESQSPATAVVPAAQVDEAAEPSVEAVYGERPKSSATRSRAPRERGATAGSQAAKANHPAASAPSQPASARTGQVRERHGEASQPSEMSLLLDARRSLDKSPRRALSLARKHASLFPDSQFAQERDALEIEALTRSGQLDEARETARRFVRRFPSSAHAHRFRERLDL